ncbi:hypothetical protein ACFL52_05190 [Candidatus Margulisiibacteriota bacterium]
MGLGSDIGTCLIKITTSVCDNKLETKLENNSKRIHLKSEVCSYYYKALTYHKKGNNKVAFKFAMKLVKSKQYNLQFLDLIEQVLLKNNALKSLRTYLRIAIKNKNIRPYAQMKLCRLYDSSFRNSKALACYLNIKNRCKPKSKLHTVAEKRIEILRRRGIGIMRFQYGKN